MNGSPKNRTSSSCHRFGLPSSYSSKIGEAHYARGTANLVGSGCGRLRRVCRFSDGARSGRRVGDRHTAGTGPSRYESRSGLQLRSNHQPEHRFAAGAGVQSEQGERCAATRPHFHQSWTIEKIARNPRPMSGARRTSRGEFDTSPSKNRLEPTRRQSHRASRNVRDGIVSTGVPHFPCGTTFHELEPAVTRTAGFLYVTVRLQRCTVVLFLQSSHPQARGPSRLSIGKTPWRRLRCPTQSWLR